jgi:hypothetical protein
LLQQLALALGHGIVEMGVKKPKMPELTGSSENLLALASEPEFAVASAAADGVADGFAGAAADVAAEVDESVFVDAGGAVGIDFDAIAVAAVSVNVDYVQVTAAVAVAKVAIGA